MNYTIKKGKHRARPIRLGLWYRKKKIRAIVSFDFTCRYNHRDDDQQDVNKLFGIGYLPNPKKFSVRFGWRWNDDVQRVDLFTYLHINGEIRFHFLASLQLSKRYILELEVLKDFYQFTVTAADTQFELARELTTRGHKRKWSFPMGIYFGGNKKAPHTMTINMKNL